MKEKEEERPFVILFHMYLDFNEHKTVHVLPEFPVETVMSLFV
jgi:hypothetical protein